MFQRLRLGFQAREGWQQRRMDVQDALRELGYEVGAEQPHEAC